MTTIFIYEDGNNLSKLVCEVLSKDFCITVIDKKSAVTYGKGYEILICTNTEKIQISDSILILGNDYNTIKFCPHMNSVIIANSDNKEQISALSKFSNNVITCGRDKSVISYSSCSGDSILVSLNMSIKALSGRIIEPLEFPISNSISSNLYDIMAVSALQLLLDDYNSEISTLYN